MMMVIVRTFLPEGSPPDRNVSLRLGQVFRTYLLVARTPRFLSSALAGCLSFGTLFLYVGGSPIIFMQVYHTDAQTFGWIFGMLSLAWIGGSQLNVLLLRRFSGERLFMIGLSSQVIISAVFLIGAAGHWYSLASASTLLFLDLSCLGLTNPNATAILGAFPSKDLVLITAAMTGSSLLGWLILVADYRRSGKWPKPSLQHRRAPACAGGGIRQCLLSFSRTGRTIRQRAEREL